MFLISSREIVKKTNLIAKKTVLSLLKSGHCVQHVAKVKDNIQLRFI